MQTDEMAYAGRAPSNVGVPEESQDLGALLDEPPSCSYDCS